MNKCLRITMHRSYPDNFLINFIQKQAKKFGLEGTAQKVKGAKRRDKNTICGTAEALDDFIDAIYTGTSGFELEELGD